MSIEETLRTIVREELTAVLQKLRDDHQAKAAQPVTEAAPEVTKPTPAPKAKAKPKAKEEPKVEPAFDEEDAAAEPLPMEDDEFETPAPAEAKTKSIASAIELLAEVKAFCEEHDCSAEAKKMITDLGYGKFSAVPDEKAQEVYDKVIKALSK